MYVSVQLSDNHHWCGCVTVLLSCDNAPNFKGVVRLHEVYGRQCLLTGTQLQAAFYCISCTEFKRVCYSFLLRQQQRRRACV